MTQTKLISKENKQEIPQEIQKKNELSCLQEQMEDFFSISSGLEMCVCVCLVNRAPFKTKHCEKT